MKRTITVSSSHSNNDGPYRYIHKYYLPYDLKAALTPADIFGIHYCYDRDTYSSRRNIPRTLSGCVVNYRDLGMSKTIDKNTVRHILNSTQSYFTDRRAALSAEEMPAALKLNEWLKEWETSLLSKCIEISAQLKRQVRSKDIWLNDYEIDLNASFYLRDDDPFCEDNNQDSNHHDIDRDASLICTIREPFKKLANKKLYSKDYFGFGDAHDHNDCPHDSPLKSQPIYQIRHCATFRILHDQMGIPMKHMWRIGRVFSEIKVSHQSDIRLV